MGNNYFTKWIDGTTKYRLADMDTPLVSLDRAITYHKVGIVSCDGALSYDKTTGILSWSGSLRIHFNRTDGFAIVNTVAAGNITLADNEFAYVDLNETDATVLTVQKAAITTGAASNFKAYNRLILAYRNATSDEMYPVELVKGWTVPEGSLPERNATISFSPEYPGAVMTADGGDNAPGDFGMTSDLAVSGNTFRNYYEWKSSITTALQDYDIFFQWRVPYNFDRFQAGTSQALLLEICTEETAATNNKIDVTLQKDGSATTSSLTGQTSASAGVWKQIGFDETDTVLASLSPGDILNVRIKIYSQNEKYARVGRIDLAAVLQ